MDAIEPKINDHGYIKLKGCKHPLFLRKTVYLWILKSEIIIAA